ncbi:Ig-like domain-containing protein [Methanobrevibacter sp.]|uniref:Ig-like domain-containing protein n=1 Tax=Methanobrevibacter sp. TaxID=66852 RepID=UPI00386E729A
MDKLKTRVLFIALIILALVSVSAVAAADSDEVISDTQDNFDLSEETVSDVVSDQDDEILADDPEPEQQVNPDGSSYVTFNFEILTEDGYKNVSSSAISNPLKISKGSTKTASPSWFTKVISGSGYNQFTYQNNNYQFDHWENATGTVLLDENGNKKFSGRKVLPSQQFTANGTNYTVLFRAVYVGPCHITLSFNDLYKIDGTKLDPMTEENDISKGGSWIVSYATFDNKKEDYKTYDKDGYHYTFSHWEDEEGNIIPEDYKGTFAWAEEDYTVKFYAKYDSELIGNFTLKYIDPIAHGSGSWSSHDNYGVDFTHTFRVPADVPDGAAVFLYWEREDDPSIKYYPDSDDQYQFHIDYEEFAGKDVKVVVYAIYDIKTTIELEEITGYFGDVVEITAKITENLKNAAVPGGFATLTIDFTTKLSNGLLGAGTYTDRVEVVDGQAVFKDIKLDATPGTYSYKVEYERYHYDQPKEGINDYLPSEAESKVNILPLNTTTTSEDVSGTAGDKVDITADIVDQNGDPVQNGTAVLKVNGKEYKAEVENGKAVFKDVELPDESTEATIEYLGNDYYNPSNTTIQITVTQPDEPEEEPEDEPADEPEEEPSTPVAEKVVPVIPAAGNPIALVVLALLSLVSTVSFGRKK